MRTYQTFHEQLIPLLVEGIGAESYLEFGSNINQTISKVKCARRYAVDTTIYELDGGNIHFFLMRTQDFIADHAEKHAPFDFVFIDADHSEKAAREDFEGIWPYVADDGLVCLHDTNPETVADTEPGFCGDSWKFARRLTKGGYEAVTLPYSPGLTIVRKRTLWGPLDETD